MAALDNLIWEYSKLVGTVFGLTAFFYVLEKLAPAERKQRAARWFFNTAYYAIAIFIWLLILHFVFNPIYSYFLNRAGGGLLPRLIESPRGILAQLLFALAVAVIWDLWQYWVHRLQHAWPVLWETHRFHHSETALNSSAQGRNHLLSNSLMVALYLPLLLFFGSLAPHFVATFVMFRLWGFVNHTNTRLTFGFLTPMISGPQWHRIHHSVYAEHNDKNFAAFFPLIDILFGTYYRPRKDEYPPTGLPSADSSENIREATVTPFLGLYRMGMARVRNLTD